jgi:hypothetical protein
MTIVAGSLTDCVDEERWTSVPLELLTLLRSTRQRPRDSLFKDLAAQVTPRKDDDWVVVVEEGDETGAIVKIVVFVTPFKEADNIIHPDT